MGKKIEYSGAGSWLVNVRLPEQLAREVHNIIKRRGGTCAEVIRAAVAEYADRVRVAC